MRKSIFFVALAAVIILLPNRITAQETVYPSGYSIQVFYTPDQTSMAAGDTLTITRWVKNNESFNLTGLYFSENLPSDFQVVSVSATRNGTALPILSTGPFTSLVSGYNAYYWIVDSPDSSENIHNTILPGDSVELQLRVTSNNIGDYIFPLHTTVFYGNGTGMFSYDTLSISVKLSLDVDDDFSNNGLPNEYLISTAYPNPFNGEVTIQYSGTILHGTPITLEIYDILGRKVHSQYITGEGETGQFNWVTDNNQASGVYLYKIKAHNNSTVGKVMLVK